MMIQYRTTAEIEEALNKINVISDSIDTLTNRLSEEQANKLNEIQQDIREIGDTVKTFMSDYNRVQERYKNLKKLALDVLKS